MAEIIETFGLDLRLIIIQIVNFSILLFVLGYFLYNPILNLLKEREEKIAKGIKDAEAAARAKADADVAKQAVLTAAHDEARDINTRAKVTADEKAAEMVNEAEEKANAIVKTAEIRATEVAESIKKEAEGEIAKTAVLAVEKLLRAEAS
ncbi:MAG: ATP synthase F0 subunit B [Candidatus Pacebacteria bacterium]|jgi:F-type H+-transporting ATPase subunit b|nr:ATP synthase F0 subunit B [Candidatus Paceibacterota bacterium]